MASLLERKLIVVTGKGGAGKSTVGCALALLAARQGRRTILAELGEQHKLATLLGHAQAPQLGVELELEQDLWSISIDPDRALVEWLQTLAGGMSGRLLANSSTFSYFAAAAPGARELVSMIKLRELCEGGRTRKDSGCYDLAILDAPATGHALGMLRSPQTFSAIVRAGPLAEQARRVRELLEDPSRSGYVAVARGTETTVTETLELEQGLHDHLGRELDVVVVNGAVTRRFTRDELARIAGLDGDASVLAGDASVVHAAARAANTVHERARVQQAQIARLRRRGAAEGSPTDVVTVPFAFTPELDLSGAREIAARLGRHLGGN